MLKKLSSLTHACPPRAAMVVGVGLCAAALILASGGSASGASAEQLATALVNIQVSDGEDFEAVKAMMDELVKRGITATLWMSKTEYSPEERSYLAKLSQAGYEIAAKSERDLRPLSYEKQLRMFRDIATAIRECTGRRVNGLRATRFTWNEDTIEVANELGVYYFMGDIAKDPRFGDVPYFPDSSSFGILGVTTARYPDGTTGILCDSPASKKISAQEFQDLLFSTIDERLAVGKPMVFEWHPASTSRPDEANPWWRTFTSFLDYLQSKGGAVLFLTAADLVSYYDPCGC